MNLMTWRIAWRNLWRHPQCTFLMIAIVAFGSWVILVMWGITDGLIRSMTDTQIVYNQGDLQLRAAGYADDPVPSNGLTPEQVLSAQEVLADARVEASSARLETYGMLRSSYGDGVARRGSAQGTDRYDAAGGPTDPDGCFSRSSHAAGNPTDGVSRPGSEVFGDSRFHANTSHRHGCSGCGLPGVTLGSNCPFPASAVDSGLTKWAIRVCDRIPTSWI